MKEELCNKLNSLPSKDRVFYNKRLISILSDHYNSFLYGGISDKEYANPPKEKEELVEETLFAEMFENKGVPLFN